MFVYVRYNLETKQFEKELKVLKPLGDASGKFHIEGKDIPYWIGRRTHYICAVADNSEFVCIGCIEQELIKEIKKRIPK